MKRALALLFLSVATAAAAVAAGSGAPAPKVAVLDTVVPQSIDQAIVVPTTEKIIERLVVSGRYMVLDRTNIESVLKEREFQLSGMVSDEEIVKAGKYLGADYVVVAKVQKVSDTYFISAKMIEIKTGIISSQASADDEGKLSILIGLAGQVGDQLAGGAASGTLKSAKPAASKEKQAAGGEGSAAKAERTPAEDRLRSRLLVSGGASSSTISFSTGGTVSASGGAFDIHLLAPVFGGLSIAASIDGVAFGIEAGLYTFDFGFADFAAGVGYALKLGNFVLFADLKGGYTYGTESGSNGFSWEGDGSCFGADLGMDWNIGRVFVLGTRYQYIASDIAVEDFDGTEVDMSTFFISAGLRL
jgi:hypothetical protein